MLNVQPVPGTVLNDDCLSSPVAAFPKPRTLAKVRSSERRNYRAYGPARPFIRQERRRVRFSKAISAVQGPEVSALVN